MIGLTGLRIAAPMSEIGDGRAVKVGCRVLVEAEGPGERTQHLFGQLVVAALFQPHVVLEAVDPREVSHLFTTQTLHTTSGSAEPNVFRRSSARQARRMRRLSVCSCSSTSCDDEPQQTPRCSRGAMQKACRK